MKKIEVKANDAGQRLDRFLMKTFESLPKSMMFKQIRKKNIKINKKRCAPEQIINEGDIISEDNVRSIRPGYGIKPKYFKDLKGKPAKRSVKRGEPITEDML